MKRTISLLSVLALVLAFSGNAFAQPSQDITATANVQSNISLSNSTNVKFAGVQQGTTPVLDPQGDATTDVGNGASIGSLDISAASSTQLIISWNTDATLGDGNSSTMDYTADIASSQSSNDANNSTDITNGSAGTETETDGTGNLYLYIGGQITVDGSQTSGSYSTANSNGTPLTVTVNYQ